LAERELTSREILSLAYPLEGHPDNLAASLLGGWVISRVDGLFVGAERLPAKLQARYVVCIPEVEVSTSRAREILPDGYRLQDVAFNLQRVSLLIHALSSGRSELIREATQDKIHQNYRATLVPGMDRVLSLDRMPADIEKCVLGVTISGSGSTVLAIVSGEEDAIGKWLVDCFSEAGISSRFLVLELDDHGAVLLD
jgi:homoserine kinase